MRMEIYKRICNTKESSWEDGIENLITESGNLKENLTQENHTLEMWDTINKCKPWIIGIYEEVSEANGIDTIFNKKLEDHFHKQRTYMPITDARST